MRNVRRALRERRIELGLTQQQVADTAGISRSSYVNIENGARNPRLSAAVGIKQALDYQDDDIFLTENVSFRDNKGAKMPHPET